MEHFSLLWTYSSLFSTMHVSGYHDRLFSNTLCHFLSFLLVFSFLATPGRAAVNVTIDDAAGDSVTGVRPVYLPQNAWFSNSNCADCPFMLDPSLTFDGTWTGATYKSAMGKTSISFQFEGSALYIFLAVVNQPTKPTATFTACNFSIDGDAVGSYTHTPDASSGVVYNVLAYANSTIQDGNHSFEISTEGLSQNALTIFDYAIYTTNSNKTAGEGSKLLSSSTSGGKGLSVVDITVIVLGAFIGFSLVVIITYLYRRDRKQSKGALRTLFMRNGSADTFDDDKESQLTVPAKLYLAHSSPSTGLEAIRSRGRASPSTLSSSDSRIRPDVSPQLHSYNTNRSRSITPNSVTSSTSFISQTSVPTPPKPDPRAQEYRLLPKLVTKGFPPSVGTTTNMIPRINQNTSPESFAPSSGTFLRPKSVATTLSAYSLPSAHREEFEEDLPFALWRDAQLIRLDSRSASSGNHDRIPRGIPCDVVPADTGGSTSSVSPTVETPRADYTNRQLPLLPARTNVEIKAELRKRIREEDERRAREAELKENVASIELEIMRLQAEAMAAGPAAASSAPSGSVLSNPSSRTKAELLAEVARMRSVTESMRGQIASLQNQLIWSPTDSEILGPPPTYTEPSPLYAKR